MTPYYTGAAETGQPQRDPALSTGGFRSGSHFRSMDWDTADPLVGVMVMEVSGSNGQGLGTLTAVTADTLAWTEPGGTQGTALALAQGEEVTLRGVAPGNWVRVARRTDAPMEGAKAIQCLDIYNNLFSDVATADAVAGLVTTRALMLLNNIGGDATDIEAWVAAGDIEIALEEPTAGELLGSGLSWSAATTEGAGPSAAALLGFFDLGLWIRRTIAAATAPSPSEEWEARFSCIVDTVRYEGAVRGRYRIERTDYVKQGIWIGASGAAPDFDAAPDETWTTTPHTTSLALTAPGSYDVAVRAMNRWGMWGVPTATARLVMDAGGDGTTAPPSAPSDVSVGQTSGNIPTVSAEYDAAADGDNRASLWVVWMETDGTAPDGSGTPDGYALVENTAAIDDLVYTGSGSALDDGTPVSALVRTRRLDNAGGTAFSPDVIQLTDSGAGTLKVDAEISDWPASGYASHTTRFGRLLEVFHYSGIAVATGQTTVTVDTRGEWGTTAHATTDVSIITPVTPTDSENTAVAEYTMVAVAPGRPGGAWLHGLQSAQAQAAVTGPDGVTPQILDAGENVHLLLGEGWTSFYIDTTIVWKAVWNGATNVWSEIYNGNYGEINGVYIPSEFALVNGDISGASAGSGVVDAVDANTVYIVVRGQRRMKIDLTAMEITVANVNGATALRERAEQAGDLERFGSTMFLAWDTEREDYRAYLDVDSDGLATFALPINQTLDAAGVEALWQP